EGRLLRPTASPKNLGNVSNLSSNLRFAGIQSMSSFSNVMYHTAWALGIIGFWAAPFLLGFGICRALRVKEFSMRTSLVLLSIFVGLYPFVSKIVQEEKYGYRNDAKEWVTIADVKEATNPDTGEPIHVDSKDKLVRRVELTDDQLERTD